MAACSLSRSVSMTEPVVLETHNMSRRSILRILLPVPISPKTTTKSCREETGGVE